MKPAPEAFDWDAPADSAVPLDALISAQAAVQEGLESPGVRPAAPDSLTSQDQLPPSHRPLVIRPVLLVTALCIGAFAHGWTTGAAREKDPERRPCDGGHCHVEVEQ